MFVLLQITLGRTLMITCNVDAESTTVAPVTSVTVTIYHPLNPMLLIEAVVAPLLQL